MSYRVSTTKCVFGIMPSIIGQRISTAKLVAQQSREDTENTTVEKEH